MRARRRPLRGRSKGRVCFAGAALALLLFFQGEACASASPEVTPSRPAPPAETPAPPRPALPAGGQLPPRTKPDRVCEFTGVDKIVAVGDLHGAYDAFVEILKGTGVVEAVDGELRWAAGRTHLVQMGDIMDRGHEPRKIFDLIAHLEGEALVAGGRVHMLIGNHEEMNILEVALDVPGGVSPGQFRDFLPEKFLAQRTKQFLKAAGPNADLGLLWESLMKDPGAQRAYYDEFNRSYGRWIARHNAVVKINDIVFVHGGLSEAYSNYTCSRLNAILTSELERWIRGERDFAFRLLNNSQGPLWHRDLAYADEAILKAEVDRILENLGARAIVVAHTPTTESVSLDRLHRFNRKVWIIDTGIWMESGGAKAALIIENGEFRVWPKDGPAGKPSSGY